MNKKHLTIIIAAALLLALAAALALYQTPNPPAAPTTIKYLVKEGDTCLKIAHDHHTTVESIMELNGIPVECPILVGQELILQVP